MTTATVKNGVNLDQLMATVTAIKENPGLAKFQFRATNTWEGGGKSRSRIKGFYGAGQEDTSRDRVMELVGDEPPVLLGHNEGPNAVEALLHGLAACLGVGFVYNAAAQGITIESLDFELEGDMDLQGFLGLKDNVRAGYDSIRVSYRVKSDAAPEKLDELCEYVQRTSPLVDIIRNPVATSIDRIG
jgi:uncharacterized OsmC-like protein